MMVFDFRIVSLVLWLEIIVSNDLTRRNRKTKKISYQGRTLSYDDVSFTEVTYCHCLGGTGDRHPYCKSDEVIVIKM